MSAARLAVVLCVLAFAAYAAWRLDTREQAGATGDRTATRSALAARSRQPAPTPQQHKAALQPETALASPSATTGVTSRAHRDPRDEGPVPRGDYAHALPALKDAASRGDAHAAYSVFQILATCANLPRLRASNVPLDGSDGPTLDEQHAAERRMAKLVDEIEADCRNVPLADIADRLAFLDRAAAGGDESAQANYVRNALAVLAFDNHPDVVKNAEEIVRVKAEGMRYMEQAAATGNTKALFNLAIAYRDGQVVAADPVMAYGYLAALQRTGIIKPALLQPWMDAWRASLSNDEIARAQAASERIYAGCCAPSR